jgi:hypothetical protein
MTRIFLAHAKNDTEESISEWKAEIEKMFRAADILDAKVVLGREDYTMHAASAGSFDGWARDVGTRKDLSTGGFYYAAFVCPQTHVGKATAQIILFALHSKIPCFLLEQVREEREDKPEWHLARVNQVVVEDPDDYRSGWWLDT